MKAGEVLDMLQARDIQLTVEGDQLRYDAPEDALTDEVLALLRQHKQALLALLAQPEPMDDAATTNGEGEKNKGLHAGDWCHLLSGDGVQHNVEPYFIASIETGPDGQQYARFYETDTGWPLAQCERTDPPALVDPPDDVEEF
jgi:tubulysin polyketide synthase-like protein